MDVNLLNQHCKPTEWMAGWLTGLLMHLDSEDTRTLEALKTLMVLRHSRHLGTWETRALGKLGHSKGTLALKALGHFASQWILKIVYQRFRVRFRLRAMHRGELSATITQLMSKCLWSRRKWLKRYKEIASPFTCCPMNREYSWKKSQREKEKNQIMLYNM